jgi:hypothetical protein
VVPGWTRFAAAEEWLVHNRPQQSAAVGASREQFDQFLAAQRSLGRTEKAGVNNDQLFQEFVKWQAQKRQ